jgi:hypothetical protein
VSGGLQRRRRRPVRFLRDSGRVRVPHHLQLFLRRTPPPAHLKLRRRVLSALILVGIIDVIGSLLMWVVENDSRRGEIHNLWDSFFFTTVQLLTVSSQMRNPVTSGGRVIDIFLELTALFLVTGIAGAFASFFFNLEGDDEGASNVLRRDASS